MDGKPVRVAAIVALYRQEIMRCLSGGSKNTLQMIALYRELVEQHEENNPSKAMLLDLDMKTDSSKPSGHDTDLVRATNEMWNAQRGKRPKKGKSVIFPDKPDAA